MNREKLQDFALVAEIVAGISIIVTLAFLALEMRSNTDAIRAQTYHELMAQLNEWRTLIVTDQGLSVLTDQLTSEGWENLESSDERRLWYREMVLWGIYESAYYANERGVLGVEEWTRFEITMCRRYGRDNFWDPPGPRNMTEVLTPDFSKYVLNTCK